ncbi:hypothetical protein F7725_019339 [Dissostichus mawsoni]|uniref:Hemimethylated DNA-binding domain-containing protein n=1 Tax=Dissostichus mawsoni TaxID=36200 RepID=A0A7J5YJS3_DISMA|nr:hypothetical protein F7725_019339 [Dissostichus mawsoni]
MERWKQRKQNRRGVYVTPINKPFVFRQHKKNLMQKTQKQQKLQLHYKNKHGLHVNFGLIWGPIAYVPHPPDSRFRVQAVTPSCAAMPQLTRPAVLQLVLLLSAVPAQYLISRWSGTTVTQRYHASARRIGRGRVKRLAPIETMILDNDLEFFGASKKVRSPRPPYVFLRVGDVVMESKGHMVGVVVSWDSELRAPQEWVDKVYSNSEVPKAENTPHYKVLFSGPGSSSLLVAYLPQTQLMRFTGTRPEIPTLENYFTHFDGERFVMQPWLSEMFPEDEKEDK